MNPELAVIALLFKFLDKTEVAGLILALTVYSLGKYSKDPEKNLDRLISLGIALLMVLLTFKNLMPEYAAAPSMLVAAFRKRTPYYFGIPVYFILGFLFLTSFPNPWEWEFSVLIALTMSLASSLVVYALRNEFISTSLLLANASILITFDIYRITVSREELFFGFLIAFLLSLIAYRSKIADETGLMAATIVGMLIIVSSDIRFFIALILFYAIGSMATKYKYRQKESLGVGEPAGGARGYSNVFANSLPALFFALNYGYFSISPFSAAFVASLSAALGDTMASEIGKTARKVYLITNFERVKPGESGGVSFIGEISAFAGSAIISIYAFVSGILGGYEAIVALTAGFIGIHVDSILGATAEKKGLMGNSGVNFFSTLFSGILALLILIQW